MMTREEAIALFEKQLTAAQVVLDSGFGSNPGENDCLYRRRKEMAEIALTALRPVSREQVEQVWRGEWRLNEEESKKHVEPIYVCTRCENFEAWGNTEKTNFCGYCGAPMTDEAVDMVMERLEALKDD